MENELLRPRYLEEVTSSESELKAHASLWTIEYPYSEDNGDVDKM